MKSRFCLGVLLVLLPSSHGIAGSPDLEPDLLPPPLRAIVTADREAGSRDTGEPHSKWTVYSNEVSGAAGDARNLTPFPGIQNNSSIVVREDTVVVAIDDWQASPSGTGIAWSHDGGQSFSYGFLPVLGTGDQVLGFPDLALWTSPVSGRTTYVCTSVYLTVATVPSICLHVSEDGGVSWSGPREIPGVTALSGFPDVPRIDLDAETGRLLLAWDHYYGPEGGVTVRVVRSDDFGLTWSPQTVFTDGGTPRPRFDASSGHTYIVWRTGASLSMTVSPDNGMTWSVPTNITGTIELPLPAYGLDFDHGLPDLAVDPFDGRLAVVYSARQADFGDVFFSTSSDHGGTWTPAVPLNANPGADRSQFFPRITAHKPSPGGPRFDVTWYDQRSGSGTSDLTEVVHRHSVDGGGSWSEPASLVVRPFHLAYQGSSSHLPSRYLGLYGHGDQMYATFAATGPPDPFTPDPDVYLAVDPHVSPATAFSVQDLSFMDSGCRPDTSAVATEILDLSVTLRNELSAANSGVSAVLSSATPGVLVLSGSSAWPVFPPFEERASSTPFQVRLEPGFACGTSVDFRLDGSGAPGPWRLDFSLPTGFVEAESTLLAENFDGIVSGAPAGWTQEWSGTPNPWAVSTTYRVSLPHSLACPNRSVKCWSRVETPPMAVPAGTDIVEISFSTTYEIEDWPNHRWAYDGARVQINVDGSDRPADSFASLFEGGYAHVLFNNRNNGNRLQSEAVWSGSTLPLFQSVRVQYPGLGGRTVKLAFELGSDLMIGKAGIFIDDLVVKAIDLGCGDCLTSGVDPFVPAHAPGLVSISPNPFTRSSVIRYALSEPAPVRLKVFDSQGRRIATLLDQELDQGLHEAGWGGTTESGVPAPNGVYFVRLEVGGKFWNRRIVLAR